VRLVYWLMTVAVALAAAVFAVNNGERVPLVVPFRTLEAPLFLVALLPLVLGLVMGALIAWVGGRHWRQEARQRERRIESLERELDATQERLPHGTPSLPA
jgi:lipopolysaccharide assembly protein A